MPLDILFNDLIDDAIGIDFLLEAIDVIEENIEVPVAVAAFHLYQNIMDAFDVGGPGWKPLSQTTIDTKIRRNAPEPNAILKEWYKMRDSIEVRDESWSEIGKPLKNLPRRQSTFLKKMGDVGRLISHGAASVGLFINSALEANRVDRGYMHEFGGWEFQNPFSTQNLEVRTGGLHQAALKGRAELPNEGGDVGQKLAGTQEMGHWVYIPERSFIRMPFDRVESDMFDIIIDEVNKLLDLL